MLAYGEREAKVVAPPSLCDSAVTSCFWWPPGFSPKAFLVRISSLQPLSCLPAINSSPCSEIALQFPFSICQQPHTPMDQHPNSGYVGPWQGLSVWFSLPSDYHRSAALPSNRHNFFPSVPTDFLGWRNLSPASAPLPWGAGLVLLALLLLPSFFHPTHSPDLPPEKSVCRSRINSYNWTWNNRLVPNWERSMPRLYVVTLLI